MTQYFVAYIATLIVFLGIDFVWLSFVARKFYFDRLGPLLLEQPNLLAASIFYLFYVMGIVHLAIIPALKDGSTSTAIVNAAVFGLLAYATYDITNVATLKGWSWDVVVVDIVWGGVLSAVSAYAGYTITKAVLG
ncbi:DUF2177 family protein [Maritalea sp.]|uniref:DUF2177 family protein n=1 Tax=Maritalea sp. TaxID=2003361 RepID=UPI003EF7C28A